YVQRVWDLRVLSGVSLLGIPLEELGFGFAFGFFWSGVYEYALGFRVRRKEEKASSRPPAYGE
ncbi:MAG: lycopene cyclase domain-containing protein, partial [Methanomicrobiales archaeon]